MDGSSAPANAKSDGEPVKVVGRPSDVRAYQEQKS